MPKDFRILERKGFWTDGDALPSPLLVFLPEGFDMFLRKAKVGLNQWDENDGLVTLVFFVTVLALVFVVTIDDSLETLPLQGNIPVSTTLL